MEHLPLLAGTAKGLSSFAILSFSFSKSTSCLLLAHHNQAMIIHFPQ